MGEQGANNDGGSSEPGLGEKAGVPGAPGPKNSESQISVVCSQLGRCGVLLKGRV